MGGTDINGMGFGGAILCLALSPGGGYFLAGGGGVGPVEILCPGGGGARGFGTDEIETSLRWTKSPGGPPPTVGEYFGGQAACGGSPLPTVWLVAEAVLVRRGDVRVGDMGSCDGGC